MVVLIGWHFYSLLVRESLIPFWTQLGWSDLLWVQATILCVLCGVLRFLGFTLEKPTENIQPIAERRIASSSLQFGIRDVLIGTTSLGVILAIAKAGDFLTWKFIQTVYDAGLLFVVLIATCTAAVLLIALWASLGRGRVPLMALGVVLASIGLGSPIAWYCVNVGQPQMKLTGDDRLYHWYATGYWWIGWMFLTGTLLAGLLIIFRTLDYRLVRKSRPIQDRRSNRMAYEPDKVAASLTP